MLGENRRSVKGKVVVRPWTAVTTEWRVATTVPLLLSLPYINNFSEFLYIIHNTIIHNTRLINYYHFIKKGGKGEPCHTLSHTDAGWQSELPLLGSMSAASEHQSLQIPPIHPLTLGYDHVFTSSHQSHRLFRLCKSFFSLLSLLTNTFPQICPYTFIGHAALMSAIQECQLESLPLKFQVEYKPIRLSCQLPEDFSVDRRTYFTKKFGENYNTAIGTIQAMGKSLGLEMSV